MNIRDDYNQIIIRTASTSWFFLACVVFGVAFYNAILILFPLAYAMLCGAALLDSH